MQPKITFIAALLLSATIHAQDLATRIPKNAYAVIRLSGDAFFKHTSPARINQSYLGKQILKTGAKTEKEQLKSIEDFGFDLNTNAYIFFERNDSISFTSIIASLKDAKKMDAYFSRYGTGYSKDGNRRVYRRKDEDKTVIWDNNTVCLVEGKESRRFFDKAEVMSRYGLIKEPADSAITAVDSAATAVADTIVAITADTADAVTSDSIAVEAPAGMNNYQYYDSIYYINRDIKRNLINAWIFSKAQGFFEARPDSAITHNSSYTNSMSKHTVVDFWINNLSSLYAPFMPGSSVLNTPTLTSYMGYGAVQGHLNMDNKSIEAQVIADLSADKLDMYRKIYQHKINPKLLDYIDVENALGYMTYSIDTKSYLELFPQYIADGIGMYGYGDKDLGAISADFLSLILDEEAIAKVMKGDMVLSINGVTNRTVSYTDYEYDDNYNARKVQKTKEESIPDFLLMFSSEDTRLINKVLAYLVKKDIAVPDGGIHKIVGTNEFSGTGILVQDGIVMIGNDIKRLRQIQTGTYRNNINAEQRAVLSNSNGYGYFNARNVAAKLPSSKKSKGSYEYRIRQLLLNMGNVKFNLNGVEGNRLTSSLVAELPANKKNPVDYILNLFELADKKQ